MAILNPFQLLEINVISAQDLEIVSKNMKTYATARVNPTRKLTGSIDTEGHNNPTWNEKFVFKVDEQILRQDTSAVVIEIYAENWLRHTIVGSVNVLVGNLIPPQTRPYYNNNNNNSGMRFLALQVRRPSGRPQGILNIGVALLDSSMRSMPLYSQMSASAVGYRDLMDDDHLQNNQNQNNNNNNNNNNDGDNKEKKISPPIVKPILRRTKSVTFENKSIANSSIVAIGHKNAHLPMESLILSISDNGNPFMKKTTKASSVISGVELITENLKGKKGKLGSVLSDSVVSKDSMAFKQFSSDKSKPKEEEKSTPAPPELIPEKSRKVSGKSGQKMIPYDFGFGGPKAAMKPSGSVYSDSEVGPSPSEVAAEIMQKRYPVEDGQSSVLDGWSLNESEEGLRSKLDRWRTELPPIYDRGLSSSYQSTVQPTPRRHSEGGGKTRSRSRNRSRNRSFSCFGNFFGYECQCICGKPSGKKNSSRSRRTPSF